MITVSELPNVARIPAGDFLMGANDAEEDERPVRRVHVSEFYVGRFPVTHEEYARFVHGTGYPPPAVRALPAIAADGRDIVFRELAARYEWVDNNPPAGHGSHPVVLVRFDDAIAYCRWLADTVRRPVRLPTEAEWEKSARGGVAGACYPWGEDIDASRCNFLCDPAAKRRRGTQPTGTYAPNSYGLYDIVGNAWEWVSDWYASDAYSAGELSDPRGSASGTMRIVRGGSWVTDDVSMLRCAHRHRVPPDTYSYSIGFRIACSA
jgi:sulfatase modifying factor 1